MTTLRWLLDLALELLWWVWHLTVRFANQHPSAAIVALIALARMFGTTVQTGWAGVLFSFGRAKKVLEPGFHPLIPIFQRVRQTPIRSITLDLPRQRVTTADGLVYDVLTTIVYRVDDPITALTAIDDVRKGVLTLLPLLVHDLLREQTRQTLMDRSSLDGELMARARQALARWGLAVEQAGMSTIAPTRPTLRLTQLPARAAERARLLGELCQQGLDPTVVTALVATGRAPRGRSSARYHRHKAVKSQGRRPARITVALREEDVLFVNDSWVDTSLTHTFETPPLEQGRKYAYTFSVERGWFGHSHPVIYHVDITAGKAFKVDFTGEAPSAAVEPMPARETTPGEVPA